MLSYLLHLVLKWSLGLTFNHFAVHIYRDHNTSTEGEIKGFPRNELKIDSK